MALNTRDVVLIALFTALIAAVGQIPQIKVIPEVPITVQSLIVMLAGGILGAWRGGLAMALFAVLVAAGLPMAAGATGGLGLYATPRGGFLLGFIFGAYFIGLLVERMWANLNYIKALAACLFGGIFIVYLIGVPWWWMVTSSGDNLWIVLVKASVFIPGDLIKAFIAAYVILYVKKSYPLIDKATA